MPMLEANDDAFWLENFDGAVVFDARGRQLQHVVSCDPFTGEVVMVDLRPSLLDRLLFRFRQSRWRWWNWLLYSHFVKCRHGFWPAPLTVVDRRAAAADALRRAFP